MHFLILPLCCYSGLQVHCHFTRLGIGDVGDVSQSDSSVTYSDSQHYLLIPI